MIEGYSRMNPLPITQPEGDVCSSYDVSRFLAPGRKSNKHADTLLQFMLQGDEHERQTHADTHTLDVAVDLKHNVVAVGRGALANADLRIEPAVGLERDDVGAVGVPVVV
jgi:hypothetical protein